MCSENCERCYIKNTSVSKVGLLYLNEIIKMRLCKECKVMYSANIHYSNKTMKTVRYLHKNM